MTISTRRIAASVACAMLTAGAAGAYEYPLQFTPPPNAQGLMVAGYSIQGSTVVGNCSFHITTSGSGRGGGSHTTYFNQTCSWDIFGSLQTIVSGAPTAPTPISDVNGVVTYAVDGAGDSTGRDNPKAMGFVNKLSAQYVIDKANGGYLFLPSRSPVLIDLPIKSVGDYALKVTGISATGTAIMTVKANHCGKVAPGAACTVTVKYDPTNIPKGDNPYTYYDHIAISLVSNSGQAYAFTETVEVPIPAGGGA